MIQILAEACM